MLDRIIGVVPASFSFLLPCTFCMYRRWTCLSGSHVMPVGCDLSIGQQPSFSLFETMCAHVLKAFYLALICLPVFSKISLYIVFYDFCTNLVARPMELLAISSAISFHAIPLRLWTQFICRRFSAAATTTAYVLLRTFSDIDVLIFFVLYSALVAHQITLPQRHNEIGLTIAV